MTRTVLPNLGELGMVADAQPHELPTNAISRVQNMRFRDGYVERFGGLSHAAPLTAPAAAPWWVQPYLTVNARYWIHATGFAVYSDDGTVRTNISGAFVPTATIDDKYTGGVLSGVLVLNNGVDVPQYWGGSGTLAALPAWNANWRARSLRPFKNHLVALGITKTGTAYPNMVKWSDGADPGTTPVSWDETDPTIDAGERDLAETPDLLVDQMLMGDANIIYKDQSMWSMRWVGNQEVFAFQRLPGDVGAAARGCIAATPLGHVVLTFGDVILHNGQGPQSILTGRMRRWLNVRMDTTYYRRSFLCTNWQKSEVWICFPQTGSTNATLALVWNWVGNTFAVRELPGINHAMHGRMPTAGVSETWSTMVGDWDAASGAWDEEENNASETRLVMAKNSPADLLLADQGDADDLASFTSVVERTGLVFDAIDAVKTAKGLFLRIDAQDGATLTVEIGASMTAEEAPVYSAPETYVVGTSYRVDSFTTGRFLAYRITSTAAFSWRLRSIDFDIVKRGTY